ncbi:hypothetical protein [Glycomyces salinus]|uniref:hypothetical protein n=1 Tax=Glycomyces salinus TaxID=980294 RepID=UPI0018ECE70E|nr:hypothetical protein [Glycomyces salinus]
MNSEPMSGPAPSPSGVGAAPRPDDLPEPDAKPAPATSRFLWFGAYALVVLLTALRAPQAYAHVSDRVPSELSEGIDDADMQSLALRSAVLIGVIVTAFTVAVYFVLAAMLEKKVFTARKTLRGRASFGLFFLIMVLCFVPTQAAGLAFDVVPRESLYYYAYILAVAIAAPWVFRGVWKGLPARKIAILFTASIAMASLTGIG